MSRSQVQSVTAPAQAGNGQSSGIESLLARKRLREGSPSGPRKKCAGRHTSQASGLLSGCNGLHALTSTAGQSASSQYTSSALQGAILSPPYQPYDILPVHHQASCISQNAAPAPDTLNARAALGTPPSEETALNEFYQPVVPYDTVPLPVVDGPLPSATSALVPSVWPTNYNQLLYPSWNGSYSQPPGIEAVSSYTADLIALGHSNSSPMTTYSSELTVDTFSGYQILPETPLSEQHLQLGGSQAGQYNVVGVNGFNALPKVTASGLDFGLPLYQGPFFNDQTAAPLLENCQVPILDQQQSFLLTQGGYTEDPMKQLSPNSASPDEEPSLFKTSQSPESKYILDEVPLKREQNSPAQDIQEQSGPSPELNKPNYGFHAAAQGVTDKEPAKIPQKRSKIKAKLDPAVELQLVHQCFNSNGRSFALVPKQPDKSVSSTKSVVHANGQRARKPLGEDERQETSRTRDVGACVRCKIQRVRVSPSSASSPEFHSMPLCSLWHTRIVPDNRAPES